MNPLTYLGFTIFSIIMQFCVMEFINERFQLHQDTSLVNESLQKNNGLIKNINRKPHALFYRTELDQITLETNNDAESNKYSNTSLEDVAFLTSTDISSSTLEVFYENSSIVEDFFTTESYFMSSETDNITEVTLLGKSNKTSAKQSPNKTTTNKRCYCDLLYQQCDVNCCCDADCKEEEISLFINCHGDGCDKAKKGNFCKTYPTCSNVFATDVFNDLFCVAKVNLPNKRIKSHFKLDVGVVNATFKWNNMEKSDDTFGYKNDKYEYGNPVSLRKNEVIIPLHLPTTVTSDYCNGKKTLKFLTNENIRCDSKIKDLYMYTVLPALEETKLISYTELSRNTSISNCSTSHCTYWKIIACNEKECGDYNKSIHAPMCTDDYCNNLARIMDFTFYYFESKIMNASLKLYLTQISTRIQFVTQEINVKWYLGNESIDNIIQLSGNPGYIPGWPIIVSSATNNHTSHFYNRTYGKTFISIPHNVNGRCDWQHINNKTLLFGLNKRWICKTDFKIDISKKNATGACLSIEMDTRERLRLHQTLFISPYGNPRDVDDDKWIPLETERTFLHGEYNTMKSKLICYNMVTRYAFVITYADASGVADKQGNKIVKATVAATQSNVTLGLRAISMILTIDVRFIDISNPVTEFASAPHFNIYLPTNFFFHDPSSGSNQSAADNILLVSYCCLFVLIRK